MKYLFFCFSLVILMTSASYGQNGIDLNSNQQSITDTVIPPNSNPKLPAIHTTKTISYGEGTTQMNCDNTTPKITFDVSGYEKMAILNSGNVGIGAASPSSTLDIRGSTYSMTPTTTQTQITGGYMTLSKTSYPFIDFSAYPYTYYYDARIILQNNDLLYFTGKSGMEFSFSNNVGIGTLTPGAKLDVRGSAIFNENGGDNDFRIEGDNNANLFFVDAGNDRIGIRTSSTSSYDFNVDGTSYLKGEVLITDNTGICGGPSASYELYVNGDAWATGIWDGSDLRYKKNIKTINSALDKIISLRGVTFDYDIDKFKNINFPEEMQYGFIAQEVIKTFPTLVRLEENGYYSVNYINLIPVLTEAIKEQQKIIDNQNNKIEIIEKELASLKVSIALLNTSKKENDTTNDKAELIIK